MQQPLPTKLWPFVWHFLKPYNTMVVAFVMLALLAGLWGPFNSMLIKKMINILSVSGGANIALLTSPAILLVLNFIVFDNITWRSIEFINYKYEPIIKNDIIHQTFDYVLGASPQFFHDNLSGRLASRINMLADNVERILHNISPNFFRGASLISVALVTMCYVNAMFFYILLVWAIAFSAFSLSMSTRLVALSDTHADSESAVSGQLVDSIGNASNVKIFARRTYEVSRLDAYLDDTKGKFHSKQLFLILLHLGQGGLIAIMLCFMLYFLMQLYASQAITVGDFALIMGLSFEVAYLTWWTMSQVDEFNQAVGKCKQSLSSLIVPQSIQDKLNANDLWISKGQIRFDDVKFQYKDTAPLFQNKSITIEAGQKVGLVGYSGGGKSTFVNLILRLFDVTDGSIHIDGHDIRDLTQDSLRRNIAMIPQDPTLFHRSLMDNIRYGRIEATDEEVIEAAKKAHAHAFISKLAQGYDSPVGERGVKLSGGQRQRIAIARAILKNAPILILDEATSQLDSVTESDIQDSLWELMQGKTTIVIAHRLSTLLHMDRIMVFDQGKIVEDGSHQNLLALNGRYKMLWDAQVGGFIPDAP
ncbi:MAG: ABC transporter ATP-binding protein [Gammaproteobacteria bacterium]